ncbi:hypothetical protein H0E87_001616 [Populus deltoides]|uniref:Uncharacterized protein n=1 Tax=Populus deltoides TaxID=3696 RepID=A0A8T2ZRJ1_POPDE|nr:hypothetical protein H0E87_001616 [Populus deltoides]
MENRWVKSTLSFREMPTFLEVENKLFVLSFENIGEKVEEVNEGKFTSLKDCEDVSLEDGKRSNWLHQREVSDIGAEVRKRNKKTRGCAFEKEEAEFSSQDPSPVSVIDFDHFIITTSVTEEDAKSGDSNSRRTLSPQLDNQNHKHLSNRTDGNLIFDDRNSKKTEEPRKKVCHDPDNSNMWGEACKLTETLVVETNWNAYKNICKFEEISADFGLQTLDQLLQGSTCHKRDLDYV